MTSHHIEAIARAMNRAEIPSDAYAGAALDKRINDTWQLCVPQATLAFTMCGEIFAKVVDDSYDSDNLADRSPKHIASAIRALIQNDE